MIRIHHLALTLTLLSFSVHAENDNPTGMSDTAQARMHEIVMEYNQCMMQTRLVTDVRGKTGQSMAEEVLVQCESHLDALKEHLAENQMSADFAAGLTNSVRSRGARMLMTRTMNNMALQEQLLEEMQSQDESR